MRRRLVAALGDPTDINCWSGIPYHFLRASMAARFASGALKIDLAGLTATRARWAAGELLHWRRPKGFQYSAVFLNQLSKQLPSDYSDLEIISFSQHFPVARHIRARGGELSSYIDATLFSMTNGYALKLALPPGVAAHAISLERENYALSKVIMCMSRWARTSVVEDCGISAAKVHVILPGANLPVSDDWLPEERPNSDRWGAERPFTLGFIGKDWRRKGLRTVLEVRRRLERQGLHVRVAAAGFATSELTPEKGLEAHGFIDKRNEGPRLLRFLKDCHLGCLFSSNEALGISTLEFLRAGVPVAGFAHQGIADTLPPDAGLRFQPNADAELIADVLGDYIRDYERQESFRRNARAWSPLMTWSRSVAEAAELASTGSIAKPVQPWRGLQM